MRKKRPLLRTSGMMRDTNLIIIASEDRYAVKQYLEKFRSTRLKFHVLETINGSSSPAGVMERLDEYMKEHDFGEGDQFWLVSDTDHWNKAAHIQNFTKVLKQCKQKGIQVAISNPCFDLWIYLHFAEFPTTTQLTCKTVGELIRKAAGSFNKSKVYLLPVTNQQVEDAIRRSKENYNENDIIPSLPQTAFHLVIENWCKNDIISIPE